MATIQEVAIIEDNLKARIIEELMKRYDEACCCDSAAFGDHYLTHHQPDNIIDMIKGVK